MNGQPGGHPARLAKALVRLAGLDQAPLRFAGGTDAVGVFEQKYRELLAQDNAHREPYSSVALAGIGVIVHRNP